jgi:hypothetical protein
MLKTSFDEKLANAKLKPWQRNKNVLRFLQVGGKQTRAKNNGVVHNQYRIF